jgi:hypothetical protein
MLRVSGLDDLARELDEAQKALGSLDGELGSVTFDPDDPASIEAAIKRVELMLDERLSAYSSNAIVGPLIAGLKEKYRDGIIERAATARLERDHK